jgi:hypothetical protein
VTSALGRNAKFASIGQQSRFAVSADEARRVARRERYELLAFAKRSYRNRRLQNCSWAMFGGQVDIVRESRPGAPGADGRAGRLSVCTLGGVQTCGSVWACPVCSLKVGERRRVELNGLIKAAKLPYSGDPGRNPNRRALLVTLTVPHYRRQSCAEVLDLVSQARRGLFSGRSWVEFSKKWGWLGQVTALEVTRGANGWHVHLHILAIVDVPGWEFSVDDLRPLDRNGEPVSDRLLQSIRGDLLAIWERKVSSHGEIPNLDHFRRRSVRVDEGQRAAEYVSKYGTQSSGWSETAEMSKSQSKRGGGPKGLTPWDFLRRYRESGDPHWGRLFEEYAEAFRGKSQLQWGHGVRERFGLGETESDEDVAASVEGRRVCSLLREHWAVLRWRVPGLLDAAEVGGSEGVSAFLAGLPGGAASVAVAGPVVVTGEGDPVGPSVECESVASLRCREKRATLAADHVRLIVASPSARGAPPGARPMVSDFVWVDMSEICTRPDLAIKT